MNIKNPFKEMKFDVPSLLLGAFAGLTAGGGVAYLVCRESANRRLDVALDEAVAEVKARYNDRLKEMLSGYISDLPETGQPYVGRSDDGGLVAREGDYPDDGETTMGDAGAPESDSLHVPDPLEGIDGNYPGGELSGEGLRSAEEADADGAGGLLRSSEDAIASLAQDRLVGIDRDIRFPYMITAEEFADAPPGWQQLTLKYFAADEVLVDDKEDPIPHFHKIVGPIKGPQDFGGVSGDPHLRYVRSQKLETDFEIVFDGRSYADGVLNYGQPNRES